MPLYDKNDESIRDDLRFAPDAIEMGFKVHMKRNDRLYIPEQEEHTPFDALSFRMEEFVIWSIRGGWRVAQVINGKYCNHRDPNPNLLLVLRNLRSHIRFGTKVIPLLSPKRF